MALWDQVKGKTQAVQIKLRMLLLETQLDHVFLRLGSRAYDLGKSGGPFQDDGEVHALLWEISARKEELAKGKEDFRKSWQEEAKELKSSLEKGDGALERVEVSFLSPVAGQKVREVDLPKEVLLGPILRGKELIIPDGETEIRAMDRVTLLGKKKDVEMTSRILRGMP